MNDNFFGEPTRDDLRDPVYSQNYFGPGVYEHYKGGHYVVFGLMKVEANLSTMVAYMTLDPGRQVDNYYHGWFGILRPLHRSDAEVSRIGDWFNALVMPQQDYDLHRPPANAPILSGSEVRKLMVPRFKKLT